MLKPIIIASQLAPNRHHCLYTTGLAEALDAGYDNVQVRLSAVHLELPSDRGLMPVVHSLNLPAYGLFLNEGKKDEDVFSLELDFSGRGLLDMLKLEWDDYVVYMSFVGVLSMHVLQGLIHLKPSDVKVVRLARKSGLHVDHNNGIGLAIANLLSTGSLVGYDLEFKAGRPKVIPEE